MTGYNMPDGCTDEMLEQAWGDADEDESDDGDDGIRNYHDLARALGVSYQQARDICPPDALEALGIYF